MRKADETSHFFFGSLNILRIRNIFIVLIPITIRGREKFYRDKLEVVSILIFSYQQ